MKYRKRPLLVEAVQFDPLGVHRLQPPTGVTGVPAPGADNWAYDGCTFSVVTIHGQHTTVVAGDWIVQERTDPTRHYPIKPAIFAESFDAAE